MLDQNVITETKAEHLLHEYQPGAFFLASPHRVLLAKGICEIVPEADGQNQMETLSGRIAEALRQANNQGKAGRLLSGPFLLIK